MTADSIISRDHSQKARDEHKAAPTEVTHDRIRVRAHQIFETRDGAPGNATLDWLQAEEELRTAVQNNPSASASGSEGQERHETRRSATA